LKKLLGAFVALVLVAALACTYVFVIKDPEKKIVGKWANSTGNIVFEFTEDGKVNLPIDFFNLGFEADINGTYKIDKKADTITFYFTFIMIDYSRTCDFKFKGNNLTLTDQKTQKAMTLIRQDSSVTVS